MCQDSFVFASLRSHVERLSHTWHNLVVCDIASSYVIWLSHYPRLIRMRLDSFISDTTHSCVRWLIHMWKDYFLCAMSDTCTNSLSCISKNVLNPCEFICLSACANHSHQIRIHTATYYNTRQHTTWAHHLKMRTQITIFSIAKLCNALHRTAKKSAQIITEWRYSQLQHFNTPQHTATHLRESAPDDDILKIFGWKINRRISFEPFQS